MRRPRPGDRPGAGPAQPALVGGTGPAAGGPSQSGGSAAPPAGSSTARAGAPAPAGAPPGAGATPGRRADRSRPAHCAGGRQFGPGFSSAPPCVPRYAGYNGGATTRGVTATEIRVVYYRPRENEVVNGFLRSQNLYGSPEDQADYLAKAQVFINKKWELYGRSSS